MSDANHYRRLFEEPANRRKLWDFERMGHMLIKLQESEEHSVQIDEPYNRATGKRDRTAQLDIRADSIMLVGGSYLLEPEFESIFNRLILLDVPEKTRLERTIHRNVTGGKSKTRAREVFRKFEHFYHSYWTNKLAAYDEIVKN